MLRGNHTVENVAGLPFADTIGNLNPYRYRGYYYDIETGLYYLNARYYDPEICRFISSDDVAYIDQETIGGVNLFAYCNGNPVMNSDPSGNSWKSFWTGVGNWFKEKLPTVVDVVITVVSGVAALASGASGNPVSAVSTFGSINNAINSFYYNYISDGISSVTPTSYQNGYVNRWERLDLTKQKTKETRYNLNALRYYGEYSVHMYGWFASDWSHKKGIPVFSSIAESAYTAEVNGQKWEGGKNWWRNIVYLAMGFLGF